MEVGGMLRGGSLVVLALTLTAVVVWVLSAAEYSELADFKRRCVAAGETAAKCEILAEIKSSADDAALLAASASMNSAGRE